MTPEQEREQQFTELRELVRKKGVDAWDLGLQGSCSPGEIDKAVNLLIDRFSYAGAKNLIGYMKKKGRNPA